MGFSHLASTRGTLTALALLGLVALPNTARAQLLTYSFTGSSSLTPGWNSATISSALIASSTDILESTDAGFAATGSTANVQHGIALGDSIFISPLDNITTTAALAVTNNKYFQFQVTPATAVDLTSLSFKVARGGASTPRGWVVRSSIDGFFSDLGTNLVPTVTPTLTSESVSLGSSFQNLNTAVTFRIYAFTPASGSGLFFDDISLSGSASVVPEPGTLALLALGIAGSIAIKRRK